MKFFSLILLLMLSLQAKSQTSYFPPDDALNQWDSISPSSLNWCTDSIDSLYTYLNNELTKGFIVLKDGEIVLEKYFGTFNKDSIFVWYSAGKSLRSCLVGIAQKDALLNIQNKTSYYLGSGWSSLSQIQEDSIKLWHHLTMTTGLNELIFSCTDSACLIFKDYAGARWAYHNSPYNLLRDVIELATGQNLNIYTNQKIENRIGMSNGFWLPFGHNDFYFSRTRDLARFGLMIQENGIWDGDTIMNFNYIDQMLNSSQVLNPAYGYLWWLNGQSSFILPGDSVSQQGLLLPDAPLDVYSAAGSQGQFVSVSPSNGLVMVRFGKSLFNDLAPINLLNQIWKRIMELDCQAVTIEEEEGLFNFDVYPNPTNGSVTIKTSGIIENMKINLSNLEGKTLYQLNVNNTEVMMSNLARGLYFIEIESDNKLERRRLIVE